MQKLIYSIANKIFMNEVEGELLKLSKKKNKIIFDVGCFRGFFTKSIISKEPVNNKNRYFLFDPNPKVKTYIDKLILDKKINYFEIALNNSNKIKKFTINKYFEPSGSSLKSNHKKDKLYNLSRKFFFQIFQPFSKIEDYETIKVKTNTIDKICKLNNIKEIDILKLDTDGNEFEVLMGAKGLLSTGKIKLIYTEISGFKKNFEFKSNKIIRLLKKYNFTLKKVYPIRSLGFLSNLKSTDNLFVKEDS